MYGAACLDMISQASRVRMYVGVPPDWIQMQAGACSPMEYQFFFLSLIFHAFQSLHFFDSSRKHLRSTYVTSLCSWYTNYCLVIVHHGCATQWPRHTSPASLSPGNLDWHRHADSRLLLMFIQFWRHSNGAGRFQARIFFFNFRWLYHEKYCSECKSNLISVLCNDERIPVYCYLKVSKRVYCIKKANKLAISVIDMF